MKLCPCGSQKPYMKCCKPFITGKKLPQTAEQLMRSRYSAYSRGRIDYIAETQIGPGAEQFDIAATKSWAESVRWVKLEVLSTEAGLESDETGKVEFIAHFIENEKPNHIAENSSFQKVNGAWMYVF